MWNSYVDMETITTVKDAAIKHSGWFYIRQNNARMENEQLYVSLAYLDHKALKLHKDHHSFFDVIDFYQRGRNINVRIKRKYEITALLDELTDSPDVKKAFNISLSQTEKFIRKVKALLIDRDIADEKKLVSFLDDELNKVLDLREAKRTSQAIYLLWFILHQITIEMIRRNKSQIKTEITALMRFMKDTSTFGENVNAMTTFREFAERIWRQFDVAERLIHLSDGEKQTLVAAQENVCPLCKQSLYWGEELHIDHRIPIAAGGPDTPENLQATHAECNLKKGAEYVAEEMAV